MTEPLIEMILLNAAHDRAWARIAGRWRRLLRAEMYVDLFPNDRIRPELSVRFHTRLGMLLSVWLSNGDRVDNPTRYAWTSEERTAGYILFRLENPADPDPGH